ncbi:MAG TPA: RraA family protein [bacterium]|nr:RraA family protein [bacterium]
MAVEQLGFRGFQTIRRPSPELIGRLARFAPPDLSDVMNGSYTVHPGIHPIYPVTRRIAGPAVTVAVPRGAFNVIKFGMQQTQPGDVMVVNAWGIDAFAVWGGNVSKGMQRRGIAGVVIDGAARDPEEAEAVDFPVFARHQATATPPLDGPGEVNVPVACGGVVVHPGDIVVADTNGIVVIPPAAADWVLRQAEGLKERHARVQPVLERGEVTAIDGIVDSLRKQGFAIDGEAPG